MAFDMHEVMATSIPRLPFERSFISGANPVTSKKEASTRSYEVPPNYFDCEPEQRALLDRALATFEYTDTSIYVGSARSFSNEEYMPCHCKLRRDAKGNKICCEEGSECINRLLQVECMRGVCPGSKYCKNQRYEFQRRQNAPVRLIHVENKGYGLQAAEDFSKGQFVMEYVGEVISHNAFVRRTEKYNLRGAKHFYFMSLNANKYIDATTVGSLARFINHSCNPNCVLQKWIVGSHVSIGIFTQRGIKKGEELTFDYKFQRYGAVAQKCYCGEPNCKGVLGSEKQTGIRGFDDPGDLFSSANFNRGLSSDGECSSLVQAMLQLAQEPEKALKVLKKLKLTEEPRLLKQFINLHGVVTLKTWLAEYSAEPEVCSAILSVLEHLPFMYKNKLLDAGVYETLREYVKSSPGVSDQVEALILRWEDLPKKYIIPRLPPSSSHTESNSPGNPAKHDVARQEPKPQASSGSLSQRVERPVSGPRHRNGRRSPTRNPRRGSLDLLPKDAASSSRLNTRRPNGSCPTRGSQPDYSGRHSGNRIDKPSHKVISQPSSDAGIQSNGSYSNCNADRGTARKVDYNSRVTCSRRDDSCDRKLSDAVAKGRPTSKCNDGRSISYGSLAPDNYYTLHDTAHDAFANGPAAEFEVLFPNHYVANVPRDPRFDASWAAPLLRATH
ncbi:hypothetical protein L0F63_006224 [Massospora cicadina]|nr:hypothetical protein L0F63_006224 [Massospora cicadina]